MSSMGDKQYKLSDTVRVRAVLEVNLGSWSRIVSGAVRGARFARICSVLIVQLSNPL
jgi:hypothetical protein